MESSIFLCAAAMSRLACSRSRVRSRTRFSSSLVWLRTFCAMAPKAALSSPISSWRCSGSGASYCPAASAWALRRSWRSGLSTRFSTSQAPPPISSRTSTRNSPMAGSSGRTSTTCAVLRSTALATNHCSSGIQLSASNRGAPSSVTRTVATLPGLSRLSAMAWRTADAALRSSSRPRILVDSERPRAVSAFRVTRFWLGWTRMEPKASSTIDSTPTLLDSMKSSRKACRPMPEPTSPRRRSPSRTCTLNQTLSSPVTTERSTLSA